MDTKVFDIIDHTADIGIIAYGDDVKQAFSHAATALFSLITETEQINRVTQHEVEVTSSDRDSLLVEWLNNLIYLFDAEKLLFREFDIQKISDTRLKAVCSGERFEPSRHKLKRDVKAATYHMLRVTEDKHGCQIRVIFDI